MHHKWPYMRYIDTKCHSLETKTMQVVP
uniref:Uncharacterized protein n=1 Tax=Arundo donax TaxID=35708 RepID=A0A0A9EKL8_ARUDO